jgi:hypothetical protein
LSASGATPSDNRRTKAECAACSSDALAYAREVCAAAERAGRATGGLIDRFLRVAGATVRLCFAGPALVSGTMPALAHLETPPVPVADLTILLVDSASCGVPMPTPPWQLAEQTYRGEAPGSYNQGSIHTAWQAWAGVLSLMDTTSASAVFWATDARVLHYSMRGAPLRDILHWWLQDRGHLLVHGAGVGMLNSGALLTGKGSSGKSTTAMICLESGLLYAGDDHVALGIHPSPWLYSLYNTVHLDVGSALSFSDLVTGIANPAPSNDRKLEVFVQAHRPESVCSGFPLSAIVLPRVIHRPQSRLRPASGAEALLALAPATILALPGAGQAALERMAELARQVPSYVLELGTDRKQIASIVTNLLAESAACNGVA